MSLRQLRARRPSRVRHYGLFVLFIIGMALLGFLAQFQWIGYVVIVGYVIFALIKKVSARTTFAAALLPLGMVPVAILFSNWTIARNFAAYCFVLLVFGVVLTTFELQREPRISE
jgi:Trk-type K+ transport system membrane component